ncbi:MAG: glycosyltransferase family 2 protein [Phycisphaerales bacterium]
MSWAWSLPISFPSHQAFQTPELDLKYTRAVVPTYHDWEHARETIDGLLRCSPRPAEIVLVDDNAENDPPQWTRRAGITLAQYPGNHGPSFARNFGARLRTQRPIEWLYFTDTGCGRDRDFFAVMCDTMMGAGKGCVACAGSVYGVVGSIHDSPINNYMTVEGILNPPMDEHGPQAIVTANALVSVAAFTELGGFDSSYPFAAGEDLDLGVKLRRLGRIAWAPSAIVRHRFEECADDFQRRFIRYGKGTAHLEHRLALPSIRPMAILAGSALLQHLADLQLKSMRIGYDAHKSALSPAVHSFAI